MLRSTCSPGSIVATFHSPSFNRQSKYTAASDVARSPPRPLAVALAPQLFDADRMSDYKPAKAALRSLTAHCCLSKANLMRRSIEALAVSSWACAAGDCGVPLAPIGLGLVVAKRWGGDSHGRGGCGEGLHLLGTT